MTRTIAWEPAYDKRAEGYGIHGLTLRFVLKGPEGAVQFLLYTNWQLPEVTQEHMQRHYDVIGGDPHWMERPMPADLGYHSRVPRYEGQEPMGPCEYLDGAVCYYDGSSLNAEPVYHRLLREGDAGVWAALEDYYRTSLIEREAVHG